jgi:hypothetical protein
MIDLLLLCVSCVVVHIFSLSVMSIAGIWNCSNIQYDEEERRKHQYTMNAKAQYYLMEWKLSRGFFESENLIFFSQLNSRLFILLLHHPPEWIHEKTIKEISIILYKMFECCYLLSHLFLHNKHRTFIHVRFLVVGWIQWIRYHTRTGDDDDDDDGAIEQQIYCVCCYNQTTKT